MKGLSQVLGLTFVYKYSQLKPKTWLRPFVNMAPGFFKGSYSQIILWWILMIVLDLSSLGGGLRSLSALVEICIDTSASSKYFTAINSKEQSI